MRNRCVGLMLAVVALAFVPAVGAEEGRDEAVPELLTDEYVREMVGGNWGIRYPRVQDEEGREVYATADTLAAARELVEKTLPDNAEISEEPETEQYYQFRRVARHGPRGTIRYVFFYRVLKRAYLERLKADDSGGVFAVTPVTPEALRRFAEWFWNTRFQQRAGAKALASEPGEPRDGKLVHVLYTTELEAGDRGGPDRISLKRTVYTCDPETGEFSIESEVVREIEGPPRLDPPPPPGDHRIWPGPPTE